MKILVGISGGAGSFCAASMLREQGNDVTGAVVACAGSDVTAAQNCASVAEVPFLSLSGDCGDDTAIIAALCEYAVENGYDAVATGHICGSSSEGPAHIVRAASERDDESYLLCLLTREQVSMLKLPLAEMTQEQIEKYAEDHGFKSTRVKTVRELPEALPAKSVIIKDVAIQKFDNPPYDRGYSSYLCGSSAQSGASEIAIKSHVYGHLHDGKLIADIIFFEDSAKVRIGEKVAVYNADGEIMLGGVCEYIHT